VACLSESDRQAIMLRFYEGKSLAEIGGVLDISEEAAKKRVARAVERLRAHFAKVGVAMPLVLLFGLMLSNTAQAAPAGMAASIAANAVGQVAASGMAVALANGASKAMSVCSQKLLAAIFTGALAIVGSIAGLFYALEDSGPSRVVAVREAVEQKPLPIDRFEKIWVGNRDQVVWQFPPRQDTAAMPGSIDVKLLDETSGKKLYAVALDKEGQYWVKQLKLDQFYGHLNDDSEYSSAYATSTHVPLPSTRRMLETLLADAPAWPVAPGLKLTPEGTYTVDETRGLLPQGPSLAGHPAQQWNRVGGEPAGSERDDKLANRKRKRPSDLPLPSGTFQGFGASSMPATEWQSLEQYIESYEDIVYDLPMFRSMPMNLFNLDGSEDGWPRTDHSANVPEPTTGLLLVLPAVLLMRRRRR
jgi:hypothetical protein